MENNNPSLAFFPVIPTLYRRRRNKISYVLLFFVLVVPFQKFPETLVSHSIITLDPFFIELLRALDEVIILLALILVGLIGIIRGKIFRVYCQPVYWWLAGLVGVSIISVIVNNIPIKQGVLGTYDLLKIFLIVLLFSNMKYENSDFKWLIRGVITISVIFALVGVAGELVALFAGVGINVLVADNQRFGLYRVISLAGHGSWNYLGMFSVLVFFLVTTNREISLQMKTLILLVVGLLIILTLSRQAWLAFIVVLLCLYWKNRIVWSFLLFMVSALMLVILGYGEEFTAHFGKDISLNEAEYYRLFAFYQSIDTFLMSPLIGVGPGSFGGVVSVMFESKHYDAWPESFQEYIYGIRSIDQFWPQLLAEVGVLGMLFFLMIIAILMREIKKSEIYFKALGEFQLSEYGRVLRYYMLAIMIMGALSGINSPLVTIPYFSLVGIYISLAWSLHGVSRVGQNRLVKVIDSSGDC